MRYLLFVLFFVGSVYGADKAVLEKQLEAIKNSEEAKAILVDTVDKASKMAYVDPTKARELIKESCGALVPYWGERTVNSLVLRLKGMVRTSNGVGEWTGTPEKFTALKAYLILRKEQEIEKADTTEETTEEETTNVLNNVPSKRSSQLRRALNEVNKLYAERKSTLRKSFDPEAIADEHIRLYRWSIRVRLTAVGNVFKDSDKQQYALCTCVERWCASRIRFFVTNDEIPANAKKGDVVTLTGFFYGGCSIFMYNSENKLYTQSFDMYSANYLGSLDEKQKKRMSWKGLSPWDLIEE